MENSRRILVAGASGAIGRRLVPALVAGGDKVFGLARSKASGERVARLGATPVYADALDRDQVLEAVAGTRPDVIIHQLTAIPNRAANPRRLGAAFRETNRLRREATVHLADAAERYGVQRLIAQSIAFAYEPDGERIKDEDAPLATRSPGAWGEIVRAVTELERTVMAGRGYVGVVLRYGGFYGPGTAVAPDGFVGELARARRLPIVGDGGGLQSFIHIDDAAGATLAVLERGMGTYNVVDDEPVPARDWIPAFAEAIGAPPPRHLPAWLVRALAGGHTVRTMTVQAGASNAKFRAELGWRPEYPSYRHGFAALSTAVRHAPVAVASAA